MAIHTERQVTYVTTTEPCWIPAGGNHDEGPFFPTEAEALAYESFALRERLSARLRAIDEDIDDLARERDGILNRLGRLS
jgi:hypothetical protein